MKSYCPFINGLCRNDCMLKAPDGACALRKLACSTRQIEEAATGTHGTKAGRASSDRKSKA